MKIKIYDIYGLNIPDIAKISPNVYWNWVHYRLKNEEMM